MELESKVTTPKPFVFVLMPFDSKFDDIYKFGIKGAAEDAGAYAERIDEQIFTEGILDRIFNQINKADVIVADMTGRNANVFYEVGYAHALGKVVLLLTQDANDIPFDLKHHQHTVYSGSIDTLRSELSKKLAWAIKESERQGSNRAGEKYEIRINNIPVPENMPHDKAPLALRILINDEFNLINVVVRNGAYEASNAVSHIYLFTQSQSICSVYELIEGRWGHQRVEPIIAHSSDAEGGFGSQYRLDSHIPILPPGASDTFTFYVTADTDTLELESETEEYFRLRLHTNYSAHDFLFRIVFQKPQLR
jgi:hypothetical protein